MQSPHTVDTRLAQQHVPYAGPIYIYIYIYIISPYSFGKKLACTLTRETNDTFLALHRHSMN